ncbi:MAG: hypothetical protein WBY53_16960 [Acidobacteriaceae bacterium]
MKPLRSNPPTRTPFRILAILCLAVPLFAAAQSTRVQITVLDENGVVVPDASLTLTQPNAPTIQLLTNHSGRADFTLANSSPYQLQADKQGFYQTLQRNIDPALSTIELTLAHQQIVRQQVNVVASTPTIDPRQYSDAVTMSTPEIVNIPYIVSRDIRYLLPFNPGVIQDLSGQAHVAGSPTYATLDLLDGFDLRSPATGTLDLHVSTDAVRTIVVQSTRYPVEYGKASGGVIALSSGMGDDRFRFNATDFIPSARANSGIHFDKFLPRLTFSGPIRKHHAWFFNAFDLDYATNYIVGLPSIANTDPSWQESNLARFQFNLTPRNNLILALLVNDLYAPYAGLSTLDPRISTTKSETVAFLPYVRDQQVFANGNLLDVSAGVTRIHSGYEPHGNTPYQLTPEASEGSYFENLTSRSSRIQESFALYLSPTRFVGKHDFQFGVDPDQISFGENFFRAPINYLREDGSLLRQSTFPLQPSFTRQNADVGAYAQDHWQLPHALSLEPGLRFDWDQIVRRPLLSPRIAAVLAPGKVPRTKLSIGIGVYYEHTQLEYLAQAFAGQRNDTYFATDGITPTTPPLPTNFTVDYHLLRAPRVINSSAELEQKLPAATYATISYLNKQGSNFFVFSNQVANQSPNDQNPPSLSGTYLLTNQRTSDYHAVTLTLRHNFTFRSQPYALFAAYTRSSATTNAAIDYSPTLGDLGPQQPGAEPWNVPNRLFAWGWLPTPLKRWDFVYSFDWHTGLPYTAIDANHAVYGVPDAYTYPATLNLSPGLEWRFHLRGYYFGLRGFIENITGRQNYLIVNNNIDSPAFGTFTEPLGRAITARIRLIGNK